MKNSEHIDYLLAKHFSGEKMNSQEEAEISQWIKTHQAEYKQLQPIVNADIKFPSISTSDTEQAWNKIEPFLQKGCINPRQKYYFRYAIAAISILLISIGILYFVPKSEINYIHYNNTTQTVKNYQLPDSSQVILYPQSSLAFAYGRNNKNRQTRLEGKAFFQVKKDHNKPFYVTTEEIKVEVLGTSFLIDATNHQTSGIYVKTGKVKVAAGEEEIILKMHEKAEVQDKHIQKGYIENPTEFFKDQKQVLTYKNIPLQQVITEIRQYIGVKIEISKELENIAVTTRINIQNPQSIAAELSFICGCKCDTIVEGKHYKLRP